MQVVAVTFLNRFLSEFILWFSHNYFVFLAFDHLLISMISRLFVQVKSLHSGHIFVDLYVHGLQLMDILLVKFTKTIEKAYERYMSSVIMCIHFDEGNLCID